jgi:hypothetical protein
MKDAIVHVHFMIQALIILYIEANAAGIGIPASVSQSGSGLRLLIPLPGWFWHRAFFHSCVMLTRNQTVRHSSILKN